MPQPEIVRRPSYGALSPVVGERGARTRRQIVEATSGLFAERGVHRTQVDDIAAAVGISRATLYQYFESKQQIFRELVEESGAAMLQVIRRLGPLGPTAEGFGNLRWWLDEWAEVYERYATMFVQWAHVDSPDAPLRPMIARWLETYTGRLSARFREAGVRGIDPDQLALALWAVVERYSYYRHTRVTGLSDGAATGNLAVVVQLMIFPETPAALLQGHGAGPPPAGSRPVWPLDAPPDDTGNGPGRDPDGARVVDLTPRTQRTVRALLDAAARVFAAKGYHTSSIDDIVGEAGLARGTFYKYFDDKVDLLVVLAHECSAGIQRVSATFGDVDVDRGDVGALRAWLAEFVALHRDYAGIFRVWLEGTVRQPALQAAGLAAVSAALGSIVSVLDRVSRRYPLDTFAAGIMLLGLLERFPDQADGTRYQRAADQTVACMAQVIERSFLNPGAAPTDAG